MSGGSLDYFYTVLQEHDKDFGDKELNALVSDLAELFHEREWFLSGDTGEGSWNEARDNFKEKWFTRHGRQERIEKYIYEFSDEIRKTFGIGKQFCKCCEHWRGREKPVYDGKYGECDFQNGCLSHRSECCKHFEPFNGGDSP